MQLYCRLPHRCLELGDGHLTVAAYRNRWNKTASMPNQEYEHVGGKHEFGALLQRRASRNQLMLVDQQGVPAQAQDNVLRGTPVGAQVFGR